MIKIIFLGLLLIHTTSLLGMSKEEKEQDSGTRTSIVVQPRVASPTVSKTPQNSRACSRVSSMDGAGHQELMKAFEVFNFDDLGQKQEQGESSDYRQQLLLAMHMLLVAIDQADVETVKKFEENKKLLDFLVNKFQENVETLRAQQEQEDQDDQENQTRIFFGHYETLLDKTKIKLCSFLWLAAECAFQAKKDGKSKDQYQKRLEIVRILARITTDKSERYVLRTQDISPGFLCCCSSETINVEGGLLHRAAQENNEDVSDILLENAYDLEAKDTAGWTAYTYAFRYKGTNAQIFLASAGAKKVCC